MSVEELCREVDELLSGPPPAASAFPQLRRSGELSVELLSWGALHHPDPSARRGCLGYLDHLAGQEAAAVFLAALRDPVPRVRRHAIHALTCEACKEEPLCVDVLAPLRQVVLGDSNAKVRFEALRALIWRAEPDAAAAAIDEVVTRGDLPLLSEAVRARRRSVPAALRTRAAAALTA